MIGSDNVLPGDKDDQAGVEKPTGKPTADNDQRYWLKLARDAYSASNDYLDDAIRSRWENNLLRFHSIHDKGSKYRDKAYLKRSKIFRPKTRSAERRALALTSKAMFGGDDRVDVRGQNRGSAMQAASALVTKEVMTYRLNHSLDWFATSMGARQNCFNYGVCISLQTWAYDQDKSYRPVYDEMGDPILNEDGIPMGEEVVSVVRDEPVMDLIPPENFRFDPNADWRDPVKDSPYLIVMLPMFVTDIKERMREPNPVTGEAEWFAHTDGQIQSCSTDQDIVRSVAQARDGYERPDPKDIPVPNEYSTSWVHLNIIKMDGNDYAFYTLGNKYMLTDPVPVRKILPLGRESITVGFSIIEAHRNYPAGGNDLAAPLQGEINDICNQRMDNVRLALNKRFIIKRGSNVDQSALMRSVPGGGIAAGDPDRDVRVLEYNDVTSSSYQEQDRLSAEQDELLGTFSGSSVAANRSLNETVGGMSMLQGDAASVAEMEMYTFIQTWVQPVLRKLQRLEAMFETDENIMAIAAENSGAYQRYGMDLEMDKLLDRDLVVSVNIGMGNTDPVQRIQRFGFVLQQAAQIPEVGERLNGEEVGKEIFAMGGFSEGERFVLDDAAWEERQKAAAAAQVPQDTIEVAKIKAESDQAIADKHIEKEMALAAAKLNMNLKELYETIGIKREANKTARDRIAAVEGNRVREMNIKERQGSGI